MARHRNKLTARSVATLKSPGRHSDGGGLYLRISPNGARSWVFMYERTVDGKRKQTELGLGSAEGALAVPLAMARERAEEHRAALRSGDDPKTKRDHEKAEAQRSSLTFGQFADEYIDTQSAEWSNEKHSAQWRMTLSEAYCAPIRGKLCNDITVEDILLVLKPIWQSKPETARRIRMRLEKILDAARVIGLRQGENPARWRGNLDHLLPKHGRSSKTHHASLPFAELPDVMQTLADRPAVAALALRFLILTAARTGEVLGARWDEIDLDGKSWTIPADRMKARRVHRVPLSEKAIAILKEVEGLSAEFVFPGPSLKKPLSNMAMLNLLKRLGIAERATVHGFRSSFRDWVAECTQFPSEVAEMALAHAVANATEAAYRRGDLFNKRREMMEAWASYCTSPDINVVSFQLSGRAQ